MKKTIFLLAFALSGCFYSGMDDPYSRINPLIQPYFDSFKYEAEARNINLDYSQVKIDFSETKNAAGETWYRTGRIIIDSTSLNWKKEPEALVFHELGHLLLHRGHSTKTMIDSAGFEITGSLMNYYGPDQYDRFRDYYIDELFSLHTK